VQRVADTEGVDVAVGNVEKDKKLFAGSEIKGKTLGLIGMGAIGGQVAAAARALGMSVVGYDPALSVQAAFDLPGDRITRVTSLGAVAAAADYISLHAPLIKGVTEGIVGPAMFDQMRPTTHILNFARGGLVDSDALLQAYQDGKYKGMYITDFPEKRLLGHENVISIPHLGASTAEAEENSAAMAADTIQDFLENGSIVNSVNFPQTRLDPLGVNAAARLCIVNTNTPGVLAKVTSLVSDEGINVVGTVNASREEIAYTVVDIDKDLSDEKVGQLHDGLLELDGVLTCRFIHQNQEAVYTMHRSLSL
jgi:D-3-phosphoglycerate dehydrogenase